MQSILGGLAAAFASLPGSLAPIPLDLAPPHALVVPVRVNGHGPFRFVVDTGAQSSALSPAVARTLGLRARGAVEVVTVAGSSVVPVYSGEVTVGEHTFRSVELLSYASAQLGIDGALGQNVLGTMPFLLDIAGRKLHLDPGRRMGSMPGVRIEVGERDGRPLAAVEINGRPARLVVDSGASDVILFREGHGEAGEIRTMGGQGRAVRIARLKRMAVGPVVFENVRAGLTASGREEDGLLPARLFRSVYLDLPAGLMIVRK